jgi:hypothetical protein
MRKNVDLTEAGRQYATAYVAHHMTKDLNRAITLYEGVIAAYPDTKEAGLSKSQIGYIRHTRIPIFSLPTG